MPTLPPPGHTDRQTYLLTSRRFPAGIPVVLRHAIPGTTCYIVGTRTGGWAYALRSELT